VRAVINTSFPSIKWDSDDFFHQQVCMLVIWHLLFCITTEYKVLRGWLLPHLLVEMNIKHIEK